jgi:hypothetical protein
MKTTLVGVTLKNLCFGIVYESGTGTIVKTAPVAKWATGKNIDFVLDYYRNKKARLTFFDKQKGDVK